MFVRLTVFLRAQDYDKVTDPSLLRFLVDLRGADATQKQLRDDLITLLIAGHETTGSMLTWATWLLAQHPEAQKKMQKEIDDVLQGRPPSFDDMKKLEQVEWLHSPNSFSPLPSTSTVPESAPSLIPGGMPPSFHVSDAA